jgi:hypothetical protein
MAGEDSLEKTPTPGAQTIPRIGGVHVGYSNGKSRRLARKVAVVEKIVPRPEPKVLDGIL